MKVKSISLVFVDMSETKVGVKIETDPPMKATDEFDESQPCVHTAFGVLSALFSALQGKSLDESVQPFSGMRKIK